jgi:hypothetical protein
MIQVKANASKKPALIGWKTREALQEYFVGTTLREIASAFDAADVDCALDYRPPVSGERRGLVQQYYRTLDFSNWRDVQKFLTVYEGVLNELENQPSTHRWLGDGAAKELEKLIKWIRKDGFEYKNGRLSPIGRTPTTSMMREVAANLDAPYLAQQIERIEREMDADPRLAIGTAKELVESVCKMILTERGKPFDKSSDVMDLVKFTRIELKLVPDDIPDSAKAADTIRRLLSNLATITQGVAELRNSYGTGHGHDGRLKGLQPRHARLAAGAACVLAKFLFDTHLDTMPRVKPR